MAQFTILAHKADHLGTPPMQDTTPMHVLTSCYPAIQMTIHSSVFRERREKCDCDFGIFGNKTETETDNVQVFLMFTHFASPPTSGALIVHSLIDSMHGGI